MTNLKYVKNHKWCPHCKFVLMNHIRECVYLEISSTVEYVCKNSTFHQTINNHLIFNSLDYGTKSVLIILNETKNSLEFHHNSVSIISDINFLDSLCLYYICEYIYFDHIKKSYSNCLEILVSNLLFTK